MKRQYLALIEEYLRYFPCVMLVGARQTGKSSLLGMVSGSRQRFDLERRADFELIAGDPDWLLHNQTGSISIDKAQLQPELFTALRVAIDQNVTPDEIPALQPVSGPEEIETYSYYRSAAGAEIDLVIEGKFGIVPIEIKHTQNVNTRQLRALGDFVTEFSCPYGLVINNNDKATQYQENIFGVPFSALCAEEK